MLTEEQRAIRAGGISGSEIGVVAGLSPYASPLDVFLSKMGKGEDVDFMDRHPLLRGVLYERPTIQFYSIMHKRRITDMNVTMVHPDNPLVIATPDGISHPMDSEAEFDPMPCVLEVKHPGPHAMKHWGDEYTDQIPDYYRPQVTWEMAVTRLEVAHVLAYCGDYPLLYRVDWDSELFGLLVEIGERFWRDHIITKKPPPPDGSKSYDAYIKGRYPQSWLEDYKEADEQAKARIDRLMAIKSQKKALEEAEEIEKQYLKEFIGEAPGIKVPGWGRIDWKSNKVTSTLDRKGLIKELSPGLDLLAKYTTESIPTRPFNMRPHKKEV